MISKKLLIKGINSDDANVLLDTGEYLNALNIRFTSGIDAYIGELSNIEGNTIRNSTISTTGTNITWSLPAGINRTIGAYEDTQKRRVIFFNKNSNGDHGIYCYDADTFLVYTVLINDQVVGGLSFDKFIHSISVIEDLLYWTDGVNPQRRINIEAGIKTNHPSYNTTVLGYDTLVLGTITPGSAYVTGTYTNVPLTGGTGSGALATIVVTSGAVSSVNVTYGGTGYTVGDSLSAANTSLGGSGSSFAIPVIEANIQQSIINLIRNQPAIPLEVSKYYDATAVNNFITNEAFQFVYRFVYRDYEVSTFSPISKLLNYNLKADLENSIDIKIPLLQKIEQDIIRIEVAVKYVYGGKYFIIKQFKDSFDQHNTGTTQLSYRFYNDSIGIAIDDASSVKPFDAIPLKSSTLEICKDRLFLGNNVDGYETPATTSLVLSKTEGGSATLYGNWCRLIYKIGSTTYTKYYVDIVDIETNNGYYLPSTQPTPPSYPNPVAWSTISSGYIGPGLTDIWASLGINYSNMVSFNSGLAYPVITGCPYAVQGITGKTAFKSESIYKSGIVFYDYAGRKCGVVTNSDAYIKTSDRSFSSVAYTTSINWSLTNSTTPSVLQSEIPEWAYYYAPVLTKCLRTSFFVQAKPDQLVYIKKDATTGEYTTTTGYVETLFGLGVSLRTLNGFGMGYSYQQGDILKLYVSGGSSPYVLKVIDTYSDFVIVTLVNLGTLTSTTTNYVYELYTPYINSLDEFYYETGQAYPVLNPGTADRRYSYLNASFTGDITILSRTLSSATYSVEAMSPNDTYWSRWNTNIGRINIILNSKTSTKKTSIYYSNNIIVGTTTNGLSTFETLSQYQMPHEMSSIQKLQIVNKVESEGTIMLAIGEQETVAIYIGEAQIFDNTGNSFLATTSGVIGNVNVMKGSYGTINPESIFRWKDAVVYFDANKGAWVRYGNNGLFPISDNKMARYFRKAGQDILEYISDPTEYELANPNLPLRVLGGVDPYHEEYLSSMPRMTLHPANTILSDMELESTTYQFATLPPTIQLIPNSLSFSYSNSGPSSKKSCTFIGSRLTENGTITVSGNSDFEISLTGNTGTFTSGTLSFPYTGTEANGVFWVRFKSGKSEGVYTATRPVAGGGASTNLYLDGTKNAASTFSVSPSSYSFSYVLGGSDVGKQVAYSGTVLSSDGTFIASGTTDFDVALTENGSYGSSISMPYTGTSASGSFWIKFKTGRAVGTFGSQNVNITNGTKSGNISCTGTVTSSATPIISPTSLSSFTYVEGSGPSASQSASYTSSALTSGGTMTITAPTNFEVSSDNSTFSASISNSYTGTTPSGTFYVRLKSGLSVSSYGPSNLTISNGTTSASISCSGSVTSVSSPPVLTATPVSLSDFSYEEGSGPSTPAKTFIVSGTNLIQASGSVTITPPTHYEISVTSATSGFSSSALTLSYTSSGTFANNTVWVRLKGGFNAGTYNGEVITLSGGGSSASVTCNGVVTAVDTSISFYLTALKNDVSSKKEVRWYLSSSAASKTEPLVSHPFYIDLQYSVYGTGIDGGISSPLYVSTLELSNIASNVAQGTLATNWVGGIYPLKVRLRTVDGSYGSYITVKDSSNLTGTNPVTITVGSQAYKINIAIVGFNY